MARILIAFGTKYGSTAEIASRIGERFTSAGFDTDVLHANLSIEISKYDGLVLGSPMYAAKWLAEPSLILIANKDRLAELPTALFSVGMIDVKRAGKMKIEHDEWVEKAFFDEGVGLNVVSTGLFNGVYERRNLPWTMRILDRIVGLAPQGDYRDWEAIDRWADETAHIIRQSIGNFESEVQDTTEC